MKNGCVSNKQERENKKAASLKRYPITKQMSVQRLQAHPIPTAPSRKLETKAFDK